LPSLRPVAGANLVQRGGALVYARLPYP
jgi:hypothetical protein